MDSFSIDRLSTHPFSEQVMNESSKIISLKEEKTNFSKIKSSAELTEYEYYIIQSGHRLANLISLFEQILHIPAYLSKYERTNSMKRLKITRFHYTKYHLENFIIRSNSILDRALQLSSFVSHTGINEKDVNFKLITRNAHIKNTEVKKALSNLQQQCNIYGSDRNEIIHQRNLLNEKLREIQLMLIISKEDKEFSKFANSQYRLLMKEFMDGKIPEIIEFCNIISDDILNLFDTLLPVYNKWKNRLI